MTKMPVIFFGHGSPMNAIHQSLFVDFLCQATQNVPRPKAILCISAHWETIGTKVLKVLKPRTIHDFYGFPHALYDVQYPAPGSLAIADDIIQSLRPILVEPDTSWGLDHGTWSILKHLYPKADVPVLQLEASDRQDILSFPYEGMELGSLSMRAVQFQS